MNEKLLIFLCLIIIVKAMAYLIDELTAIYEQKNLHKGR